MIIHLLVRAESIPGEGETYRALCKYESDNKREFSINLIRVTCEKCRNGGK